MKKAKIFLALAAGMLLASCGHKPLTPEEISAWYSEHASSSIPQEQSSQPAEQSSVAPSSSAQPSSSQQATSSAQQQTSSAQQQTSSEQVSSSEVVSSSEEVVSSQEQSSEQQQSSEEQSSVAEKVTVTFDCKGGSAIDPVVLDKGEKVDVPDVPTRDGYDFVGWYRDPSFNNAYDFALPVEAHITLYALWEVHVDPQPGDVYGLFINGEAVPGAFADATAEKGTDTCREQLKITVTVSAGDVLTFQRNGAAVEPGIGTGSGNNVKVVLGGLQVINDAEDVTLWFKIYDPETIGDPDGYSVWLEGYEAPTAEYAFKIGENDGPTFVDATAEKGSDTCYLQLKATVTVTAGDLLTFTHGDTAIAPGAGYYAGNNVKVAEGGLEVINDAADVNLWFKVYHGETEADPDGYSVWLEGYEAPTPQPGDEINATVTGLEDWWFNDVLVFACYWGTSIDGGWVAVTKDSATQGSVTLPAGTTGFLLVRCADGTTATGDTKPNWGMTTGDGAGRIYNQTGDITIVAEQTSYACPSWSNYPKN